MRNSYAELFLANEFEFLLRAFNSKKGDIKMKKIIVSIMVILTSVAAVSAQKTDKSMDNALMAMEKQAWDAYIKKDGKFFGTFLTDDATLISEGGIASKAQSVNQISNHNCAFKNYSFNNFKTTMLDKDTALVTYEATQEGTCGGQNMPGKVYASSVYVKRGGKWVGAFHQETAAMMMQ